MYKNFIPYNFRIIILIRYLCYCLVSFLIITIAPSKGFNQTTYATILSPAAQEALNKGIMAAKVPDYLLTIRYFEEARKIAPDAPIVFYNLGLAESKIPGRELRAIACFGAYITANPDAPNAAAVRDQMDMLVLKNQSNTLRFIKLVQDAACQISDESRIGNLIKVSELWARAGDITAALKSSDLTLDENYKGQAQKAIAQVQAESGDFTGAMKTTDLIQDTFWKCYTQNAIAEAQIKAGNLSKAKEVLSSALKSADLIQQLSDKRSALTNIAESQAKCGDIAGAQKTFVEALKTADLIQDAYDKCFAQLYVAEAQARNGDFESAQKTFTEATKTTELIQNPSSKSYAQLTLPKYQAKMASANSPIVNRQSTSDTQAPIKPVLTSDWLRVLDEPYIDLANYQKSLTKSVKPQEVFNSLYETAVKIVGAHNYIAGMLIFL